MKTEKKLSRGGGEYTNVMQFFDDDDKLCGEICVMDKRIDVKLFIDMDVEVRKREAEKE